MHVRLSFLGTALCLLALSTPAWASIQASTNVYLIHSMRMGTAQLKAGKYKVVANESTGQVKILHNYQLVAKVKGKWVELSKKPNQSEMLSQNRNVQEIRFSGMRMAIKFPS